MLLKIILLIVGYLLGSLPVGFLLVKYVFARGEDIRTVGSGGIGATNVARRAGWPAGLLTYLFDFGKGALAVLLMRAAAGDSFAWMGATAIAAMVGHVFPLFLGFRGGKGVATGAGAFLMLAPYSVVSALAVWILVTSITRYVSLASITAAAAIPIWTLLFYGRLQPSPHLPELLITGSVAAGLIVFKHAENIKRLLNGTENKIGVRVGPAREGGGR